MSHIFADPPIREPPTGRRRDILNQKYDHILVCLDAILNRAERGILSTIYLRFSEPIEEAELRKCYQDFCADKAFVHLLEPGVMPDLKAVAHSNHCVMNLFRQEQGQDWVIVSAIDNLVKGAAGQALQNMNLMFGLAPSTGLV